MLPIPALRRIVAANCHKMQTGCVPDVCGVQFPGLEPVA
jgi:hypothetical protein